ncbi:hypothetical protein ACJX0J_031005 [Zea mays]
MNILACSCHLVQVEILQQVFSWLKAPTILLEDNSDTFLEDNPLFLRVDVQIILCLFAFELLFYSLFAGFSTLEQIDHQIALYRFRKIVNLSYYHEHTGNFVAYLCCSLTLTTLDNIMNIHEILLPIFIFVVRFYVIVLSQNNLNLKIMASGFFTKLTVRYNYTLR